MRFLFTTIPGSGHFFPAVPTARALQDRGHEVTVAASPAFAGTIEAAGLRALPCGPSWLENLGDPLMQRIVRGELFIDLARMGMVEDLVRAVSATGADMIVTCGGEFCGRLAAAITGIPVAAHAAGVDAIYREMVRPGLARVAVEHGLDGERVAAPDQLALAIARTPPVMDIPGRVVGDREVNVRPEAYDGGGSVPGWLDELGGRPLVYLTLGTVFNGNIDLFGVVLEALAGEALYVVVSTGRGLPPGSLGALPANAHAVDYLPQGQVLPRAAVVASHGGYGTAVGALAAGVPQLLLPMGADQPYNAERIVAGGAGLSLQVANPSGPGEPPRVTPPTADAVRDAVHRLLGEYTFKAGAQRAAAEIAAMPPVVTAAARLERVATRPSPVRV